MKTTVQPGEYRVYPSIQLDGYASADGVYVNLHGEAFIGEVVEVEVGQGDHLNNTTGYGVLPYSNEGDYIPLPISDEEFQSLINQTLVVY